MSLEPIISWTPFNYYLNLDIGPTSEVGKRLIEDLEVLNEIEFADAAIDVDFTNKLVDGSVVMRFENVVVALLNVIWVETLVCC